MERVKPKFKRLHFVTVSGDNRYAFGLAFEQELLIAVNGGPGEFVIQDSTFVDERFVSDSDYLIELLIECLRHWLYDDNYIRECFKGKVWVNPDLKNVFSISRV